MEYDPTMPQFSMPLQMYPQQGMMGNPQYNQLINAQAMPQQPAQDPMAAQMEQMRQQKMLSMMGQGIASIGKNQMQIQAPTQQIIRDQGGPRYTGNQQQMMAQALRNRG